jgi:hypothetical protein
MLALAKKQILNTKPAPKPTKWGPLKTFFAKTVSLKILEETANSSTSGSGFSFRPQHEPIDDATNRFSGKESDDLSIVDL